MDDLMRMLKGYVITFAIGLGIGAGLVSVFSNYRTEDTPLESKLLLKSRSVEAVIVEDTGAQRILPDLSEGRPASLAQVLREFDQAAFSEVERELGDSYLSLMIEKMGHTNPAAAVRLLDLASPNRRNDLAQSLAYSWSERDAPAALAWFLNERDKLEESDYDSGLASILGNYAKVDPRHVYSQMSLIADEDSRDGLFADIARGWAKKDPEGAVHWLNTLSPAQISSKALTNSYKEVMERYATVDPSSAALAIGKLESESLREQLVPMVAVELASEDPESALEWVLGFPELSVRQLGLERIVERTVLHAPDEAMDILLSAPDMYSTDKFYAVDIFRKLVDSDMEMVVRRFEEIPYGVQASVAESLATARIDQGEAIEETLRWAGELPSGEVFDGGARVLVDHLSKVNPVAAIDWAGRLSQKKERYEYIRDVIERAEADELPGLAGALIAIPLEREEKTSFQALVDKRLSNEFSTLVLP